jgi:methionyl-tRNA formyltransferase
MTRPRVAVFGYGSLALAGLETLEHLGVTPAAIVVPGNRVGSDVDVMTARAAAAGWPLLAQPQRTRLTPFLESLDRVKPDLLFVWSYPMLLPPELIARPRLGAINMHGGLLPEYRGAHVMNWVIANGASETGMTLHYIDDGIDTGPTIAERRFPIEWRDDAATVRDKLRVAGQSLLREWWPAIEAGTAPRTPQDPARAGYYRPRSADDGRIDWSAPNEAIYNLVRALVAPWPGARTSIGRTMLVTRKSDPIGAARSDVPGTVQSIDEGGVVVASGRGSLHLQRIEIDGRVATLAELRQAGVVPGAILG